MWRKQVATTLSAVLNVAFVILTLALAVVNGIGKADPQKWKNLGADQQVAWLQQNTFVVAPLLIVVIALAQLALKWSESPRVWSAIHGSLDDFRDHVFSHLKDAPEHERRVTLFQYVRFRLWFCWPMTHWLVPVERSGESTRWRVSTFRAPLGTPGTAEGVAGQAFTKGSGTVVSLRGLPLVKADKPDDQALRQYSATAGASESRLRAWLKRHPGQQLPTSICGIPVVVNGKRWGVLVLDACGDLEYDERFSRDHKLYASILARLLTRNRK
jgi:hypothetical protein